MDYKLVTNRLKLNDAATEESILKAIDAIENRAKAAEADNAKIKSEAEDKAKADEEEMDKLKAKIEKAEAAAKAANAELEKCKAELDAMNEDKLKAEEAMKAEKAKNMVEDFAKAGRIKNEASVILKWTNTALSLGLDEVKDMIEALPLNKEAEKIEQVINKVDVPTTAVGLAAKLRAERNNQ